MNKTLLTGGPPSQGTVTHLAVGVNPTFDAGGGRKIPRGQAFVYRRYRDRLRRARPVQLPWAALSALARVHAFRVRVVGAHRRRPGSRLAPDRGARALLAGLGVVRARRPAVVPGRGPVGPAGAQGSAFPGHPHLGVVRARGHVPGPLDAGRLPLLLAGVSDPGPVRAAGPALLAGPHPVRGPGAATGPAGRRADPDPARRARHPGRRVAAH